VRSFEEIKNLGDRYRHESWRYCRGCRRRLPVENEKKSASRQLSSEEGHMLKKKKKKKRERRVKGLAQPNDNETVVA
jgi:hypothetical protein